MKAKRFEKGFPLGGPYTGYIGTTFLIWFIIMEWRTPLVHIYPPIGTYPVQVKAMQGRVLGGLKISTLWRKFRRMQICSTCAPRTASSDRCINEANGFINNSIITTSEERDINTWVWALPLATATQTHTDQASPKTFHTPSPGLHASSRRSTPPVPTSMPPADPAPPPHRTPGPGPRGPGPGLVLGQG